MLRLFTSIRRSLLNEGKTVKYLKYAFGEFVLVVLGILVALQINNWNEERLLRVEISVALAKLKTDLESDTVLFDDQVHTLTRMMGRAQRIVDRKFNCSDLIRRGG